MKLRLTAAICLTVALFAQTVSAATLAELKLINPLEESRGWCVDLFAHLTGGLPIGGFQGHNCFSYMDGGPTEDQGFDAEMYADQGVIRLDYFDICMTVHEPRAGSFVASEPCTGEDVQKFDIQDSGEIVSRSSPNLCLTMGTRLVTGGGGEPIHLIRKLSFEDCDSAIAERQQWELRTTWQESTPTRERPYN
mgnify:CR=1 FL=1